LLPPFPDLSHSRRVREKSGYRPGERAWRRNPRTLLKWDYNLEIHDGEGASTQAGSYGIGG
jgi:hypothetical protein